MNDGIETADVFIGLTLLGFVVTIGIIVFVYADDVLSILAALTVELALGFYTLAFSWPRGTILVAIIFTAVCLVAALVTV